jgi:acyl-CoA reductase-like NAD-dependent aldehyde dehydrogenase
MSKGYPAAVYMFEWPPPMQVVAAANDNPYGLAAGVLATDQHIIDGLVRRLRAGTVWVNTYNVYDAGAAHTFNPFLGGNDQTR